MSTSTPSPAGGPGQVAPAEPTAKERFAWMGRNSRILLAALVLIVIALFLAALSSGLFTSSSANPGNLATSGIMTQDNDRDGLAILTAERLLPGEEGTGTVTISNVGDADGNFTLTASNLADVPADPAFSSVLTLTIADEAETVYNGPLASFSTADLGTWSAGEEHTYTFTVIFAAASGNEYQDARTTLDFTWNATQS